MLGKEGGALGRALPLPKGRVEVGAPVPAGLIQGRSVICSEQHFFIKTSPPAPALLPLMGCTTHVALQQEKGFAFRRNTTVLEGGRVYFLIPEVSCSPVTHANTPSAQYSDTSHSIAPGGLMSMRRDAPRTPMAPPVLRLLQPGDSLLQRARRAQYKCLAPFSVAPTAEYARVPIFCSETSIQPCTLPGQKRIRFAPPSLRQCPGCRRATQAAPR